MLKSNINLKISPNNLNLILVRHVSLILIRILYQKQVTVFHHEKDQDIFPWKYSKFPFARHCIR
jgi:hypothetical protein